MLILKATTQYKKDIKLARKRGKSLKKLNDIVDQLQQKQKLAEKYKDHKLVNWDSCRECHVEPDWLLIYKQQGGFLILVRTGSHSDLFG